MQRSELVCLGFAVGDMLCQQEALRGASIVYNLKLVSTYKRICTHSGFLTTGVGMVATTLPPWTVLDWGASDAVDLARKKRTLVG